MSVRGFRGRTTPGGVRRNASLDVVVAVGYGLTAAVVSGLLPTIARQQGLVPIGIALLAASPFLGNLLSGFAGRVGPHGVRGFAATRITAALLLVGVAFAPHPALIVAAVAGFWLCISFGVPFQTRLWGSMYPAEVRGRVIGTIGMARAGAAGVAALAVGFAADRIGVPLAVTAAGIIGAMLAIAAFAFRSARPMDARHYSPREAVATLSSRPRLRSLVMAQAFYGGGLIAAAPLYALVHVDRLHLSLAAVGTIAVLTAIATTASYPAWGAVVDRAGPSAALRIAAAFGVVGLALYAIAPDVIVLWPAAIVGGIASAGIDLGIQGAVAHETPLADRAAAMAGWNTLTGARGILVPIVASVAVQAGLLSLTGALLLCLVASLVGLVLYAELRIPAQLAGRATALRRPSFARG